MKRSLIAELKEGFDALAGQREEKLTLRTHAVTDNPAPEVSASELIELRRRLNVSRAIFAAYMRTNVRTLENWEQGRSRPNAQAAVLIRLVEKHPDMWSRLQKI
ncbi:MAG: transcriptional regulator [Candidatus Kapabacteria bacterium]|nr:transcriptional regulator [Candidatus Kapabacteria bacterium]